MRITSLVTANMWIAAMVAVVAVTACSSDNDPAKKAAASKDAGTSKDSGTSSGGGNSKDGGESTGGAESVDAGD